MFSINMMKDGLVADSRIPVTCRKYFWQLKNTKDSLIDDVALSQSIVLYLLEEVQKFGFSLKHVWNEDNSVNYLFERDLD